MFAFLRKRPTNPVESDPKGAPVKLDIGLEAMGIEEGVSLYLHTDDDIVSECIQKYKSWEWTETQFALETVKPGHTVLDIGANVGYFTAIFGKLVGPSGRVFAAEPNNKNFELLVRNIEANRLDNVHTVKALIADKSGLGILHEHVSSNRGGHTALEWDSLDFVKHTVHPKVALDSLIDAGIDEVHFIKMDTQGSEPLIFKGGKELIRSNARRLNMVVEFSPAYVEKITGAKPEEFYREIIDIGFAGYFIDTRDAQIKPVDDIGGLIKVVRVADGTVWPKNLFFADLIFKPLDSN
jgi:FkbM family methyltransferase